MEHFGPGVELELQFGPVPQTQQHWIQDTSVTCAAAYCNTGSLTQLSEARNGTHILTETVSGPFPAEPQWEPPQHHLIVRFNLLSIGGREKHMPVYPAVERTRKAERKPVRPEAGMWEGSRRVQEVSSDKSGPALWTTEGSCFASFVQ